MTLLRMILILSTLGVFPGLQAQCWLLEPSPGSLLFVGKQAGAPVRGEFRSFDGKLFLSSISTDSFLEIRVDINSIKTGLPELDVLLLGDEFFMAAAWPSAHFTSTSIEETEPGRFAAEGQLQIRNVTNSTLFTFHLASENGIQLLTGESTLQRLDYDVGIGEWRNINWVGNQVTLTGKIPLARVDREQCQ